MEPADGGVDDVLGGGGATTGEGVDAGWGEKVLLDQQDTQLVGLGRVAARSVVSKDHSGGVRVTDAVWLLVDAYVDRLASADVVPVEGCGVIVG